MHLSDLWVYILLCSSRIPAGWLCTWGHTVHNAVERVVSEKSQGSRESSAGLLLCYNIQQSSPRVCMDTNISKWSVNFFKIKQRFQQTGSISKMFVYRKSRVEPEEMFLLFFIQSCWISRLAFVLLVCGKKLNKKTAIWMMRSSKWFADVWERLLWTKLSYLYSYGCFVIYMLKTFFFLLCSMF